MFYERFDLSYLLIGAVLVLVVVGHYWLARLWAWAGAIIPLAYLAFVGWLFATGRVSGLLDVGLLLLGLLALVAYWSKARESAREAAERGT